MKKASMKIVMILAALTVSSVAFASDTPSTGEQSSTTCSASSQRTQGGSAPVVHSADPNGASAGDAQ